VVVPPTFNLGRPGWEVIRGAQSNSAHDLNLGIAAAGEDDVLYVADNIEFIQPVVEELLDVMYRTSSAIVSAQPVNRDGVAHPADRVEARWRRTRRSIPFKCALLRRSAMDLLGPFHESASPHFDLDYCSRALLHDLSIAACRCRVVVDPTGSSAPLEFVRESSLRAG
jgi:hypothetical protein